MTDTVNVQRDERHCADDAAWSELAKANATLAAAPKAEPVSDPYKSESYWFDPRDTEVTATNPDNILSGYYVKFDVTMIQCGDMAMFGFWFEPADGSDFQYRYFSDRDQAEAEVKAVQASIRALRAQPEAPKVEQEPFGYAFETIGGDWVMRKGSAIGGTAGKALYTNPAPSSDELPTGWEELQRLAEAASPGPWKACATIYEHMNCEIRTGAKGEGQPIGQIWDGPNAFADGQFIAAASPQVVLKLIAIAQHKGPQS